MSIVRKIWGRSSDGKPVYRYFLKNSSGAGVVLCNIGAGVVAVNVPDRDGRMGDVAVGYGKAESYFGDGPCAGKCPGRYANRIGGASFVLDGVTYHLPANDGRNHLHGGPDGFQNKVWESRRRKGGVEFRYESQDGESGYPGRVRIIARYEWSENNELKLVFKATTDKSTILNLTNHSYFNLDGHGSVLRHRLKINASEYIPTDDSWIPSGDPERVDGSVMDFRQERPIARGYNTCWCIDGYKRNQLQEAATLLSRTSGRKLTVFTTQPGIQVYTGDYLEGCPVGKRGRIYHNYDAVALECQHYPDSPNHSSYPSTILRPHRIFKEVIVYSFTTI